MPSLPPFLPGYREWAPPPELRDAVACIWSQVAGPADPRDVWVLPDGCSDLIWHAGRGAFVAGPDTGAWRADLAPRTVMVGVRFAPGAGGPALRLRLAQVRDQRVAVADALPSLGHVLPPDLALGAVVPRLLRLAADLVDEGPPDGDVQHAASLLADPGTRLATLTRELGVSERSLRRRFDEAVGYGPKTLQRVLRLRRFLDSVVPGADLAGLAAATGYADQAHLTRECRELTGQTPAVLAGRGRSAADR